MGPFCIPPPLVSDSLLTILQFLSPIIITSLPLKALNQSVKGRALPFQIFSRAGIETTPHSPTPTGHSSAPSSNLRPLHSQPPHPGARCRDESWGMPVGSAGLQTHIDKGENRREVLSVPTRIPVCGKPCLCVYPHAHHTWTHSQRPESHHHPPAPRAQGFPLPGVRTVRLAGASTWPGSSGARQR